MNNHMREKVHHLLIYMCLWAITLASIFACAGIYAREFYTPNEVNSSEPTLKKHNQINRYNITKKSSEANGQDSALNENTVNINERYNYNIKTLNSETVSREKVSRELKGDSFNINAHKCMILPILDKVGGVIGIKVFEKIEEELKSSDWCEYVTNSEILNILGGHEKNLDYLLENPEVLKTLAARTNVGSLIKIDLYKPGQKYIATNSNSENESNTKELAAITAGMDVFIKIIGSNGQDILFKEEGHVLKEDVNEMANVVKKWLIEYSKTIPYEGQVTGILGNQINIDAGGKEKIQVGDAFVVKRLIAKKEHPLLKKIIEWESETIAHGEIFNVTEKQSVGVIREEIASKKIENGDWVVISKEESKEPDEDRSRRSRKANRFPEIKDSSYGKIGSVGAKIVIGQGECSNIKAGNSRKVGGEFLGLQVDAELWGTRNFFIAGDVEKDIGTYKKKLGDISNPDKSITLDHYRLKGGYRFLPLGAFFGPQVDGYLGYARYAYDLESNAQEGFGQASFYGIFLGTKIDIPIYKDLRTLLRLDFFLRPGYAEDTPIFGSANRSDGYEIELGGSYSWNMTIKLDGSLQLTSNQANFVNPPSKLKYKETRLKMGLDFYF